MENITASTKKQVIISALEDYILELIESAKEPSIQSAADIAPSISTAVESYIKLNTIPFC